MPPKAILPYSHTGHRSPNMPFFFGGCAKWTDLWGSKFGTHPYVFHQVQKLWKYLNSESKSLKSGMDSHSSPSEDSTSRNAHWELRSCGSASWHTWPNLQAASRKQFFRLIRLYKTIRNNTRMCSKTPKPKASSDLCCNFPTGSSC